MSISATGANVYHPDRGYDCYLIDCYGFTGFPVPPLIGALVDQNQNINSLAPQAFTILENSLMQQPHRQKIV
jgi:hypothetical protein